ncbi:hypothetical protein [Hyphomicrobium sulfonivorans]|uniref:hypothetical protein n=1 Tax=Hyphomicrobium sulfonivorans TaxID=121290 RepID=UPI00156E6454|nr:hypothetical protein [Hyphomicrobium sulfonivorans]MBI1648341.1 hypothetical protein [Hyphomicrobium sulfonivorans]
MSYRRLTRTPRILTTYDDTDFIHEPQIVYNLEVPADFEVIDTGLVDAEGHRSSPIAY